MMHKRQRKGGKLIGEGAVLACKVNTFLMMPSLQCRQAIKIEEIDSWQGNGIEALP